MDYVMYINQHGKGAQWETTTVPLWCNGCFILNEFKVREHIRPNR